MTRRTPRLHRSASRILAALALCVLLCSTRAAFAQDPAPDPDLYFVHDLVFPDGRRAATIAPQGWVTLDHAELVSPDGLRIRLETDSAAGLNACQWARMRAQFVDFPSDKTLEVNATERRADWTRPRGALTACLCFMVSGRTGSVIMRAVFESGGTAYSLSTERLDWGRSVDPDRFRTLEFVMNLFSNYFYFEGTAGHRDLQNAARDGKPLTASKAPSSAGTPDTASQSGPPPSTDPPEQTPPSGGTAGQTQPDPGQSATQSQPLPNPAAITPQPGAGTFPKDADLERAKRLVRRGRFDEAEAIFRGLMVKAPYDARAGLGDIAEARGDYQAAIEEFQAALLINPRAPEAYNGLGKVAFNRGDYDQAKQYFDQALERAPADTVAMTNLGWVRLARGDVSGAQEWFSKALEAGPSPSAATGLFAGLTQVALARGEPGQALNYISELLRADPESAVAQASLAQANLMLNDPELALNAALRAIERDPARHEFHFIAGEAAAAAGTHAEAASHYEKAIELAPAAAPQAPAYFLALARTLIVAGRRNDAQSALDRALKRFPDNPDITAALNELQSQGDGGAPDSQQ